MTVAGKRQLSTGEVREDDSYPAMAALRDVKEKEKRGGRSRGERRSGVRGVGGGRSRGQSIIFDLIINSITGNSCLQPSHEVRTTSSRLN